MAPANAFCYDENIPLATGGSFPQRAGTATSTRALQGCHRAKVLNSAGDSLRLAAVAIGSPAKWGYIDESGRTVMGMQFTMTARFPKASRPSRFPVQIRVLPEHGVSSVRTVDLRSRSQFQDARSFSRVWQKFSCRIEGGGTSVRMAHW